MSHGRTASISGGAGERGIARRLVTLRLLVIGPGPRPRARLRSPVAGRVNASCPIIQGAGVASPCTGTRSSSSRNLHELSETGGEERKHCLATATSFNMGTAAAPHLFLSAISRRKQQERAQTRPLSSFRATRHSEVGMVFRGGGGMRERV